MNYYLAGVIVEVTLNLLVTIISLWFFPSVMWATPECDASLNAMALKAIGSRQMVPITLDNGKQINFRVKGFNPADKDNSSIVNYIESQLAETLDFLQGMARDNPHNDSPIETLTLQPGSYFRFSLGNWLPFFGHQVNHGKQKLSWHGGQELTVNIPKGFWSRFKLMDADTMRRLWNQGFQHTSDSLLSRHWSLLNPVGPIRIHLRNAVKSALTNTQEKLTKLMSGQLSDLDNANGSPLDAAGLKDKLSRWVKSSIPDENLSTTARKFLEELPEMPEEELRRFIGSLVNTQHATSIMSELDQKISGLSPSSNEPDSTSTATAKLVAVANAHDIRVSIRFADGTLKVDSGPTKGAMKVTAKGGLVAVATSDRVYIDVNLETLAPSAIFENAVKDHRK